MRQEAYLDEDENDEDEDDSEAKVLPEQENSIRIFAQNFYEDVKVLAIQYVEYFFNDKKHHSGGKIPKSLLLAERRISMVMNYDIIQGVERAYKYLEKEMTAKEIEEARQSGETTSDIKLVNSILGLLARSGVPQQFAGGMMCLYLEFIEGVNIGSEP